MSGNTFKFQSLILALAAGGTLMACGGGGGGGGTSPQTQAAFAGVAAASLVRGGMEMAADNAENDGAGGFKSYSSKADDMCDSGSQSTSDSTGPAPHPSPYHSGDFQRTRMVADNCSSSFSEGGFSGSFFIDGVMDTGSAAAESVFYMVAENFITESSGFFDMSMAMNGAMHICDGCPNPEDPESSMEMKAFFQMEMDTLGMQMQMAMGSSLNDMLNMRAQGTEGGAGSYSINGRMASNRADKPQCSFDVTYETLSPLLTQNAFTESETVVSGELNVSPAGGGNYHVVIDQGVVSVDGVVYSEEELNALAEECLEEEVEFEF